MWVLGLRPNGYERYSCIDTFMAIIDGLYSAGLILRLIEGRVRKV